MKLQDIDIHFDVQMDSNGKDPDSASPTLKAYHQLLWSKLLPNGQEMKLEIEKNCLKWGDMWFGCDSITASFLHWRFPLREYVMQNIPHFAEWKIDYWHKTYTIGGSIIFPMHTWSMNQARGCSAKICDRWDLTLECIRRFYVGEPTPLDKALEKDREFFNLLLISKDMLISSCSRIVLIRITTSSLHLKHLCSSACLCQGLWMNTRCGLILKLTSWKKRGRRIEEYIHKCGQGTDSIEGVRR